MSRPKCSTTLIAGLATLSLLLVLVACSDSPGKGTDADPTPTPVYTADPTPTPVYDVKEARAELAAARERWEAGGSADYDLEFLVLCECPESNKRLKLIVRNGAIESSVFDLDSGRALTEEEYDVDMTYKTINDRFDQIESALGGESGYLTPAHELSVNYHPDLGYPTYFGVSYGYDVADAGFRLELLVYKPYDPSATPEPDYDVELARKELASARERWEARGSVDYDFDSKVSCECPESDKYLRIIVRNGAIKSVVDRESGRVLTEEEYVDAYTYHTINSRFDQIEDALGSPPVDYLIAEYDDFMGNPTYLSIIYRYDAPYEGFILEATQAYLNPDPTPPPATPASAEEESDASSLSLDMDGRYASVLDLFSNRPGSSNVESSVGPAATVEEVMVKGLRLAGASPVHVAVRGTAVADSTRCDWRGIARTAEQREDAIRFWLKLDADDDIPDAAYLETLFTATISVFAPEFQETAKSNFQAIALGGLSMEYMFLTCFADYAVNEYLLGAGPTTLTLDYDRMGEAHSYDLYVREHASGTFGPATSTPLQTEAEHQAELDRTVWNAESALAEMLEGYEGVLFLAPMGAHNAIAVEAWQVVAQWDLQMGEDGVVNAVRYGASEYDPEHSQPYTNLKSRIDASVAANATSTKPIVRIVNVDGLTQ